MEFAEEPLHRIFQKMIRLHYYRAHTLLEQDGIYPGQPPLLFALHHRDGQSQKELAEKLKIAPATITVMIKRMEKAGLLEKRQDKIDHRMTRIFLTESGHKAYLLVEATMNKLEEESFNHFTIEEKFLFKRLMIQVIENLK